MTDQMLKEKIEEGLEQLRPNLQMDGGDVTFIRFEDGVVYIKFLGACATCPDSIVTLRTGIEENLRQYVPDLREVIAVQE